MKKPLAFVVGVTENLGFAAGNVALALARHMKTSSYELVVLARSLHDSDRSALQAINKVIIRDFRFPDGFECRMLDSLPEGSRFKEKNHLMCFSHFEVFRLLEEYQNVVWLDVDTSIQKPLDEIVNFGPFGISADTPWTVGDNFTAPPAGYKLDLEGVCTAVMVVNDSLAYRDIYAWCYLKTQELAPRLKNPDQAIINLAIQEFSIDPKILPLAEWQCIAWRDEAIDARIVHFGTHRKVWNSTNVRSAFPEWHRVQREWEALGGRPYPADGSLTRNALPALDYCDEIRTELVKSRNLEWRLKWGAITVLHFRITERILRVRLLGLQLVRIVLKPA